MHQQLLSRTVRWFAPGIMLLVVVAGLTALAAETEKDSVDRDYSKDLPRLAPKEPAEAMATFKVAPGFRLEQVVAEPLVADPVAICFDENSRLFVVEMRGYSENRTENLSRIRLLEDLDNDGKYESSKIFVDNLAWPTALFYWNGGLIVADAPDIFYYQDTNGDGKADSKQVLFTGIGTDNVQGLINTFLWNLDNRIIVSLSASGAELRKGDAPKDAKPLVLRGRDLAIEPRTMTPSAISGGAQHGMSMNDWGDRFVCSNSDHLQEIMYEDRYLARNPYLVAPPARRSIAEDGPQAEVYRASPVEAWREIRTRLRAQKLVPGHLEGGGRAAGYFTGATGVTIYRGDAFPGEANVLAIIGDVGSNIVHRKRLSPDGIGYRGERIDEKSELVASSDNWFRPAQFANAPDGTLYIMDMYREVIEHPGSLPPMLKKHIDLTSGRDRGRLYRLVPTGYVAPVDRAMPKLGKASTAELVALLEHPNGWHRDTAARLLYERRDSAAVPLLRKLAGKSQLPQARIHALWGLDGLQALTAAELLPRLHDAHPRVREHAVRMSEELAPESRSLTEQLLQLTSDPEQRVRYQLAFSLGELPSSAERNAALVKLAMGDSADPYMRMAVLSSLSEGAGQALGQLTTNTKLAGSKEGQDLLRALAAQIGKQQRPEDVQRTMATLAQLTASNSPALSPIVQALAARSGSPLAEKIAKATGGKAAELMATLMADSRRTAADESATPATRVAAVEQLRMAPLAEQQATLMTLLVPTVPADVQVAVLGTLASYDAPAVAELILAKYQEFSPSLKGRATNMLLSRTPWTLALLGAMESGQVGASEIDPARLKQLAEHRDEAIRAAAAKLLSKNQLGRRADVVAAYRQVLEMSGDAARGKQAFQKTCAACHRLEGVGQELGPNLAAMKARGPEAILLNVLDPNREVNPQYVNYALITTDGRSFAGIIAAETATSVTLKRGENARDNVLRIDIETLQSTGLSLMPEGLEKQIDPQTMADLLEYFKKVE